jgi:hypothetical protein
MRANVGFSLADAADLVVSPDRFPVGALLKRVHVRMAGTTAGGIIRAKASMCSNAATVTDAEQGEQFVKSGGLAAGGSSGYMLGHRTGASGDSVQTLITIELQHVVQPGRDCLAVTVGQAGAVNAYGSIQVEWEPPRAD